MVYKAEYIWIDGAVPTAGLRSKTRVLADGAVPGVWGFDGVLDGAGWGAFVGSGVAACLHLRGSGAGGEHVLVLCEVEDIDFSPHASNTRVGVREVAERFAEQEVWFGIEQEYTLFRGGRPLGFPEGGGFPAPQGPYYCGVGGGAVFGRELVERHLDYCLAAGLVISGINAEVMPGQWEFQVGPAGPVEVADHMWVARYLLLRVAEEFGVTVSFDAKPEKGDWNGAGAHTNFSTRAMRESYDPIITACEALGEGDKPAEHVRAYGSGIEERLTGEHETAPWNEYSYGVSDRGASVRIPWQVEVDKKGYIEDRRPNANVDPYVVTRLIVDTCCSALEKAGQV